MATLHDYSVDTIDGESRSLADYKGKTLLVVNVASKCGLTPHYEGLERLQRKYKQQGLEVLGFPCNQFMEQEPGSNEEIKGFCSSKYDVTFDLFSKLDVNGDGRAPLYQFLTSAQSGPDGSGDIAWNFVKFVVDGEGQVVARFDPRVEPEADEIVSAIEKTLG